MSDNVLKFPDLEDDEIQNAIDELDGILAEAEDEDTEVEEIQATGEMDKGMGTPVAEYGEDGPYHCINCWYLQNLEPRGEPLGRCNEPHMMKDPKTKKDESGLAIVNKKYGCCRYVDPVKCEGVDEKFVFAHDSDKEEKEHLA